MGADIISIEAVRTERRVNGLGQVVPLVDVVREADGVLRFDFYADISIIERIGLLMELSDAARQTDAKLAKEMLEADKQAYRQRRALKGDKVRGRALKVEAVCTSACALAGI